MLDNYRYSKGEDYLLQLFFNLEVIMKNLVSFNQLKKWSGPIQEDKNDYGLNDLNEYFECITECDIHDLSCKRECRTIFV